MHTNNKNNEVDHQQKTFPPLRIFADHIFWGNKHDRQNDPEGKALAHGQCTLQHSNIIYYLPFNNLKIYIN